MEYTVREKARQEEVDNTSYYSDDSTTWFLWQGKTKEILGRTVFSWLRLFLFYFLFCSILALLWGLCIGIFFQTVDFYIPKYIQTEGVMGRNPGLGFRPQGGLGLKKSDNGTGQESGPSVYSSLIWFRHGADGNWGDLKESMDIYLAQYEPGFFANQGASLTKCDFLNTPLTPKSHTGNDWSYRDKSCEFNKEWLSDQGSDYKCITQEDYGYRHGKPCILVKLNRIYNWIPEPYTMEEIHNHTTMPLRLKQDIQKIYDDKCEGHFPGDDCPYLNMIWLHCDGENDPDIENIGPVTYTPFRGFPGYFYPYRNQRGYLSPIVMVQLKNPEPGVLMNIECTAWARNIQHNRLTRRGLVHFELIMD